MRQHTLGRTGLSVSEIALGTVELGLDYGIAAAGERLKPDRRQAMAVLHQALDLGITLVDTARAYGDAEEIIGEALKGRRSEYVLVSKIAAGPEAARASVEASLRALQTGYIDVMMIHCGVDVDPDPDTAAELTRMRDAGAIRYLGASVYGEKAALAAIDSGWCDCIEISYSALDRRPETRTLENARDRGVGVLARSVLLKGALTSRIGTLPPEFAPLQAAVRDLCEMTQTALEDLPELAYRYVLMHQPPQSALVGSADPREIRACIACSEKGALSPDIIVKIRALAIPKPRWLNPGFWPPLHD